MGINLATYCRRELIAKHKTQVRASRRIFYRGLWFPENEIQITNLPVSAGDLFFCLIVSTSSTGANVILSNMTTNLTTALEVTAPTGTTLVGNCAEWIVELPEAPDVQLANYGSVTFLEAYSGTNLAGSDAVRDPSEGDAVNMIGGDGKVISTGNVGHLQVTCSFV
jgi:Peptidase A4 family